MRKNYIALIAVVLFSSCNNVINTNEDKTNNKGELESISEQKKTSRSEILTPVEYSRWILDGDNGCLKTKSINEFNYTLQYCPAEYMVCKNLKKRELTKAEFDDTQKQFSDLEYFTFKIDISDFNQEPLKYKLIHNSDYNNRVMYYSFDMQKDIRLKSGDRVVTCKLFHFERDYGTSPFLAFTMGFDKLDNFTDNDITFTYDDPVFNTGRINITFKKTDLQNIPELKLL